MVAVITEVSPALTLNLTVAARETMSNQRIEMFRIKGIIELWASKKSNRVIARILGISRNTLDSYLLQLSAHNTELSTFYPRRKEELSKLLNPQSRKVVPASH